MLKGCGVQPSPMNSVLLSLLQMLPDMLLQGVRKPYILRSDMLL